MRLHLRIEYNTNNNISFSTSDKQCSASFSAFDKFHWLFKYNVVCFCSRSEVCGEKDSSASPGDDQCGLSAYFYGQQQRFAYILHIITAL